MASSSGTIKNDDFAHPADEGWERSLFDDMEGGMGAPGRHRRCVEIDVLLDADAATTPLQVFEQARGRTSAEFDEHPALGLRRDPLCQPGQQGAPGRVADEEVQPEVAAHRPAGSPLDDCDFGGISLAVGPIEGIAAGKPVSGVPVPRVGCVAVQTLGCHLRHHDQLRVFGGVWEQALTAGIRTVEVRGSDYIGKDANGIYPF
ncbi:hypothetical protein [Amycolatopsis sp. NPDC004169]|uniref:hypothetical protein n=1 Tax=Amycolatopsis sp. NPDC004169 TaxID=3154453 RepID=UPI0033AE3AB6